MLFVSWFGWFRLDWVSLGCRGLCWVQGVGGCFDRLRWEL